METYSLELDKYRLQRKLLFAQISLSAPSEASDNWIDLVSVYIHFFIFIKIPLAV